jgi:hypothetical protein
MTKDKNADLEEKVHSAFLTEAEKLKIQKEVEEQLDKENKKKVADDYRDSLIQKAKKKALLSDAKSGSAEGLVPVYIELPAVSECIRIDGAAYYPGRTYNVKPAVKELILEIMHRGAEHENSLNGKTAKENMFRKRNKHNPKN